MLLCNGGNQSPPIEAQLLQHWRNRVFIPSWPCGPGLRHFNHTPFIPASLPCALTAGKRQASIVPHWNSNKTREGKKSRMSLGLRDPYERRRRQRRWMMIKILLFVITFGILLWAPYGASRQLGQGQIVTLLQQLADDKSHQDALQADNGRLEAADSSAHEVEEKWRRRYETDVATGYLAHLLK